MKKVLLTLAVLFATLTAVAQTSVNIVTDKTRIDDMIWSQSDQEFLYFSKVERHSQKVVWEFTLNDNRTGTVKVTELGDGDKYGFNIYNWEIRTDDKGKDYARMDVIQVSNSEKATIMVSVNEVKQQLISIFMPDSKVCLFFDNLPWE